MDIRELNGKTICILGFGKEGQSAAAALERNSPECEITVADKNDAIAVPEKYWKQVGSGWLANLNKFDVLIKSPGIPPNPELDALRSKLITPTQLFFDSIRGTGARVIGVTGSKGKSTTSSLIAAILQEANRHCALIGNIGNPALDALESAKPGMTYVMELSSYQLLDLTCSPQVAVITSFFPEHLDYHGSLEAYWEAKSHIARFQSASDVIYYNAEFPEAKRMAELSGGKHVSFSPEDAPLPLEDTHLIGRHNLGNMAAATLVAKGEGIDETICIRALRAFNGLPHRLQSLGTIGGITWVDDSISTTPESTIAALDALGDRVRTILLGGQDRGYDFTTLGRRIASSNVQTVILFPGSGPRIRMALEAAGCHAVMTEVTTMERAVTAAKGATPAGETCLLSPASPSYGLFKNFEERGNAFASCIGTGSK